MIGLRTGAMIVVIFLMWVPVLMALPPVDGYTQADRDRAVRIEATLLTYMQQNDRRMEQVEKRFDDLRADMNARFEQVDKRFEQMDKRFEQVDKRFEQIDKRFEQTDTRIEELRADMNARFEQINHIFYMLSGMFTALFVAVFGFAWWDRSSVLITARKSAREEADNSTRNFRETVQVVHGLVDVLRGMAEKMPELKELMRRANLL